MTCQDPLTTAMTGRFGVGSGDGLNGDMNGKKSFKILTLHLIGQKKGCVGIAIGPGLYVG